MVELQFSKLTTRVRFPSPAPAIIAHVAQLVEHFLGREEVTGSIPVMGTSLYMDHCIKKWMSSACRKVWIIINCSKF